MLSSELDMKLCFRETLCNLNNLGCECDRIINQHILARVISDPVEWFAIDNAYVKVVNQKEKDATLAWMSK